MYDIVLSEQSAGGYVVYICGRRTKVSSHRYRIDARTEKEARMHVKGTKYSKMFKIKVDPLGWDRRSFVSLHHDRH